MDSYCSTPNPLCLVPRDTGTFFPWKDTGGGGASLPDSGRFALLAPVVRAGVPTPMEFLPSGFYGHLFWSFWHIPRISQHPLLCWYLLVTFGESSWCSASLALQVPHTWLTALQPPDEFPAYSLPSADTLLGKKNHCLPLRANGSLSTILKAPVFQREVSNLPAPACSFNLPASAQRMWISSDPARLSKHTCWNPIHSSETWIPGLGRIFPSKVCILLGILSLSSRGFFGVVFYSSLVVNSLGIVRNSFLLLCGFHFLTTP